MRRAALLLLPLLAGCGSTTGRVYAWRPGAPNVLPPQLGIDHRLCVSEANRAYTPQQAAELARRLEEYELEYLEQPIPAEPLADAVCSFSRNRASPKSATLACLLRSRMLSGLMSRWMTAFSCACCRA